MMVHLDWRMLGRIVTMRGADDDRVGRAAFCRKIGLQQWSTPITINSTHSVIVEAVN